MNALYSLTTLILAGTALVQPAGAGDCRTVLNSHLSKANGTIFYNSGSTLKSVQEGQPISDLSGQSVYLLRKNIHRDSAGGVLVVKIGRMLQNRDATVTLKSKFAEKFITRCTENAELRKRLKSIDGAKVSYKQFQDYVLRPSASRLNSDVREQLDRIHFAYKGSIDLENSCDKWTNRGGNLRQHSLVKSDTGGTTFYYRFARTVQRVQFAIPGFADESFDWTVRMIPYDRDQNNGNSVACIRVTAPEIVGARVVRINDLEERMVGTRRDDPQYDQKHRGDRSFDLR